MEKKIIGICEGSKYSNYEDWLHEPDTRIIKLGYKYHNLEEAEKCDGILLTGGDDVSLELYMNPSSSVYENQEPSDKQRDEFEWKIMEHVEKTKKPLLAICRGLQFVNVFFGGKLLPDLPASRKLIHAKFRNGKDRLHTITLDTNSVIYKIVGEKKGIISSGHHQCVSDIGGGLKVTAMSPDGVIEALEKKDNEAGRFFMTIQWHPERTMDKMNSFAVNIKKHFIASL